jgi:hypothetical protein
MKMITKRFLNITQITVYAVAFFVLAGCGGGGGTNSTSSQALPPPVVIPVEAPSVSQALDYQPDADKLSHGAETSSDLYVEPDFDFNSTKVVTFDVSAADFNDSPLSNRLLAISLIDNGIMDFADQRLQDKSIIAIVKTDTTGRVYLSIEMPISAQKVLLELKEIGLENKVMFALTDGEPVIHHFKPQLEE